MIDKRRSSKFRSFLGRGWVCALLWCVLVFLTIASVVPHWSRFARDPAPVVPHIIESAIGPDVRGSVVHWRYWVCQREGEVLLFDEDDPGAAETINAINIDEWDEIYGGNVFLRWEPRGLWWPSVVTTGYRVTGLDSDGTVHPDVRRAVDDWIATIPRLAGKRERTTRITWFALADLLMLALVWMAAVGTVVWIRDTRKAFPRDPSVCGSCGYDITGITTSVCPECGTPFDDAKQP